MYCILYSFSHPATIFNKLELRVEYTKFIIAKNWKLFSYTWCSIWQWIKQFRSFSVPALRQLFQSLHFRVISRTLSFNFQDFPGPGKSRKKSRTFHTGMCGNLGFTMNDLKRSVQGNLNNITKYRLSLKNNRRTYAYLNFIFPVSCYMQLNYTTDSRIRPIQAASEDVRFV